MKKTAAVAATVETTDTAADTAAAAEAAAAVATAVPTATVVAVSPMASFEAVAKAWSERDALQVAMAALTGIPATASKEMTARMERAVLAGLAAVAVAADTEIKVERLQDDARRRNARAAARLSIALR